MTRAVRDDWILTVEASVEQLVYVREDEYTVARMSAEDMPAFVASGRALAGVQPGETLKLVGEWDDHPRHGRRLMVSACERVIPSTVRAIELYLGSGLIRGIGPRLAHAIVSHFGEESLTVIDTDPVRLREVINIGPVRQAQIVEAWREQKAIAALMVVLQGYGVSPLLAAKVYQAFGAQAAEILTSDPYRLIGRVRGIAFSTADRIALRSGVPESSPQRIQAAVLDRLDAAASGGGHCYLPLLAVLTQTIAMIGQEEELIRQAVDALVAERRVVTEPSPERPGQTVVYAKEIHSRELALTDHLTRLFRARSTLPMRGFEEDATLNDDQRAAVTMALAATVSVLTGGPGCGKSHTVRAIAATVRAMGGTVTLAAPTGKAAKRLSELTGVPAMTVHRMLAHQPDPDALFDRNPAHADLIVVDEASMLDLHLATRLCAAIPSGATCCSSATATSSPASAPATSWPTCCAWRTSPGPADPHLPAGGRQRHRPGRPPHPRRELRACPAGAASGSRSSTTPRPSPSGWSNWRRWRSRASRTWTPVRSRCCARCARARRAPRTSAADCRNGSTRPPRTRPSTGRAPRSSGSATGSCRSATTTTRASSTARPAPSPASSRRTGWWRSSSTTGNR
nr:hypothetical protein GCM10020093_054470 [Planobispora longispora]